MIQVLAQTLEARDEANARHLFDVFETLLILVRDTPTKTLMMHNPPSIGNSFAKSAHTATCSVLYSGRL
jgi:hypothetical protein